MSENNLADGDSFINTNRRKFIAAVGGALGISATGSAKADKNSQSGDSPTRSSMETPSPTEVPPLEVYEAEWLSDRLIELTFETPLMNPPLPHTNVRVLLPSDYDMSHKEYPTIYLLHGGEQSAAAYTTDDGGPGPVQNYIDDDVVVVMPDAGPTTWYTDWFNDGAFGSPMVETFHIRQLIPFIESNFRVRGNRQSRVVGGFSMGCWGALKYGARHPDLFGGVFGSSGTPYRLDWAKEQANQDEPIRPQKGVFRAFGDPRDHETRWKGHLPYHIPENYNDMPVYLASGRSGIERRAYEWGQELVEILEDAGIDVTFESFEDRGHELAWAHRDLKRWQSDIKDIFAGGSMGETPSGRGPDGDGPPGHDGRSDESNGFTFRSIDTEFEVWGWQVYRQDIDRETAEFITIDQVNPSGLTLTGQEYASFVTPPVYKPRADYRISVSENANVGQETVTADDSGRLDFTVETGLLTEDYEDWVGEEVPSAEISIEPAEN